MPAVAIAAAASAAMTWASGATIFGLAVGFESIAASFGISLVLGGLSYALTPKPKKSGALPSAIPSNTIAERQAAATRKHVYGHTRITDVFAHMEVTDSNGKLHAILILCSDEVESIDEIWANDVVIPPDYLDSNGNVTAGQYAGYLCIRKHLGSPSQTADPVAVSEISEWTSDHKLQGMAYLYITMTKNQDVYPSGMPNFSAIVKGRKLYDPRTGDTVWSPNCALFAYDFLARADFGFAAFDQNVDADSVSAAANIADEIVDTASLEMTVSAVDTATGILTVSGTDSNGNTLIQSLFELGDRVRVSSGVSPTTNPGGLAEHTDYYVIPYQMKGNIATSSLAATSPRIKLAASLADAITGTAVTISSAGSGTITITKTGEPRYHGAGVVDTQVNLGQTLTDMMNAMAGRAVNAGGLWRILAGAWVEPTLTLGIGDFRGAMGFTANVTMASRFNTINGLYIGSLNQYQPADYPTCYVQDYIDQDNGLQYPLQLNLPFTNRPTTAQRITRIELNRARQEIIFTAPAAMKAYQVQAGDTVMVTIDRYGWSEKIFEVTQCGLTIGGGDNPSLLTQLTLRETASAIFDWSSSSDASIDPAPNTLLPNPFLVDAPVDVAYNSRAVTTPGGDTVYNLVLTWTAADNAFVLNHGSYEIQFKLSSDSDWRPYPRVPGDQTFADILSASINTGYDVRIRAVNNLGARSAWQTLEDIAIGSSGGIETTMDWGSVADAVGTSADWGSVADAVGTSNDWGSVV